MEFFEFFQVLTQFLIPEISKLVYVLNIYSLQECTVLASKLWRRISVGRKIRRPDPRKTDNNQNVI